jgi:hypothetical protein
MTPKYNLKTYGEYQPQTWVFIESHARHQKNRGVAQWSKWQKKHKILKILGMDFLG